jgi:hypothetical protein
MEKWLKCRLNKSKGGEIDGGKSKDDKNIF